MLGFRILRAKDPGAMPETLRQRLAATSVTHEDGRPMLVHHATRAGFRPEDIAPLSHFGTRQAARDRMGGWRGTPDPEARVISGFLDIRSPLWCEDINDVHGLDHFMAIARRAGVDSAGRERIATAEEEGQGAQALVEALRSAGHDGLAYRNLHEDPGSVSWVLFEPDSLIPVAETRLADLHDPWSLDAEAWTGPAIILDVFDVDGRSEEYAHLFEALTIEAEDLPMIERDAAGWEARWLPDWHPEATLGLHDPSGTPRGFYMSGQLWIDPEARGAGRSALLILAAAELRSGCPAANTQGLGFSPAGHAAHLSAHRACLARAIEEGLLDPEEICGNPEKSDVETCEKDSASSFSP